MSGDTPTVEGALVSLSLVARRVRRPITTDGGGQHTATQALGVVESELARLLAEVEQLKYEQDYTPPTGALSEGLRAIVKAAGQACLDGEADCVRPGCVVGHQAGEILDAYDDAAADVERLTEERDAIWAERVEEGKVAARAGREAARLADMLAVSEARLTECQGLLASERESSASIAAGFEQLAAKLDAEVEVVDRTRAALDGLARIRVDEAARLRERVADIAGWGARAHKSEETYAALEGLLSRLRGLVDDGGATPSEPGNGEYIAWSDGGMVGPAPGHGEPDQ